MDIVIDTNVPIVANGGPNVHASPECRLQAIEFLKIVRDRHIVLLDEDGEIQDEYQRHLQPSGQPGVGDQFYRIIIQSSPQRVSRVRLPKDLTTGEYVDFPQQKSLASFDVSDRKFAALGIRYNAPVYNATDSDWWIFFDALTNNGLTIEFVCGKAAARKVDAS